DIRFISHHDLMRVYERALRRADLPIAMSEGHNPRPRLSLPAALSVGCAGLNEVADFGLSSIMRPAEFRSRLQAELPEGIRILSAEVTSPHPSRQPTELSYRVPLLPEHELTRDSLDELMARDEVVAERQRKDTVRQVEIRRYLKALRLEDDALHILLRWDQTGTARPEEVLEALGCRAGEDYRESAIERTHVRLSS
ncbi:MAG: TIGR03936 family radical SAM-associated protein, partial [Candidatus Brocadiia bacterium]